VTVVVTQINSKRIYMMGEVAHTGPMPMSPNMTVMQALASAGVNQFANTKKIYLLRNENGKQEKLPVPYNKLMKGQEMDRNYPLQAGDTIVVP
jgi:polysaccharide export outer membrane protein